MGNYLSAVSNNAIMSILKNRSFWIIVYCNDALSKEETVSEKQFLKKYFDPQNKFNVGNSF